MLRTADKRLAVNEAISCEAFNADWPEHLGSGRERIIHQSSPEFGMANFHIAKAGGGSVAWPSANKPIAMPFRIFKGTTIYQIGWKNGSGTMTDSADVGIYDTSWNRKVSSGSVARAGVSSVQWADVTDTFLQVGKYYLVMSNNGTTAGQSIATDGTLSAVMLAGLGCFDSGTNAFVLPDPLTNMVAAATFTQLPMMFMAGRVPF